MKKVLLILTCFLSCMISLQAQNANRKGFFLELQGGSAFGNVINWESESLTTPYIKGGIAGSFDFGYRFATSRSFAIELKGELWGNFLDFYDTFCLSLLPGCRWTSREFTSNVSVFVAYNMGLGAGSEYEVELPLQLAIGVNLTNNLNIGLFISERVYVDGDVLESKYTKINGKKEQFFSCQTTYTSAGIRLGYRF